MNGDFFAFLVVFGVSYLLGSIPFGFLVARMVGIDNIMAHGSGNIGATNVFRVLGPAYAVPVLALDAGKGALAAYLGLRYLNLGEPGAFLAGLFAIAGHNWSIFLKFRGGKGVATSAGVAIVAFPELLLVGITVFAFVVLLTKYVSLGSLLAVWVAFVYSLVTGKDVFERIAVLFIAVLVTYRHRSNISRLLSGTESKLGQKSGVKKSEGRRG
ncbi:MAG TPA: glycerol-3-phosphate 1-O-acyltransferase PlsY [Firmicutes bacterium]|uniref:Glycerol-3-phosphate acyltransferase n=1 Tax=Candidatus Fermentithermobacillus carboniphilus TaxID=3085328 RepID=A0AAT9LDU4_9FIRM|nr:MAG: glycerol-3-phosphate 1-O-acyltransferase PlsY [Candidatus Fermentithermobacillus carboniphilus]HHW17995.1 glycerol-3-phosphate 1-O-acyltransferase PlsY [Candidatus Fermentithermobacillaceae bacterium]